jgi:hypothetical protein
VIAQVWVLLHIFTRINSEQHSELMSARYLPQLTPVLMWKSGYLPKPQEVTGRTMVTLNDSTNDPETNFGNIRESSSIGERETHHNPHTSQQIEPVRTSTPKHDPFQKIPFAKSFTNRRWPSDLLRWPLALLLPSTHRNNNIALQRILNHLSTKNLYGAIFRLKL